MLAELFNCLNSRSERVSRPITVDIEFLGAGIDPWGNQRIGFSGVAPRSTGRTGA